MEIDKKNDTRDLTITNRKIVEKIYGKKNGKQYNKSEIYYQINNPHFKWGGIKRLFHLFVINAVMIAANII